MRTKTLLITGALGVAGVATAIAQVYSVNAVGYVNLALKPGFNMIQNPLDAGAGKNTVASVFAGMPDGTIIYKFTAGAYVLNAFDPDAGWALPNMEVAPGQGVFVKIPGSANVTVTFVGEVMQGDLKTDLPSGFAMVGSKVPQAGKLVTDLKYPQAEGDTIYTYANPAGYTIYSFDPDAGWGPSEPSVAVGEAFWSKKVAAATWARSFSVNQ